nr:PREDICTED: aquaporin-12A [Bemisia tabaci]XP_018903900.1 PREDICTED: aquaporin-12A [Bemisia tabaci]XP_018903901.1 PREDICTED: aquaporin-12A [Bemisia tabaci]
MGTASVFGLAVSTSYIFLTSLIAFWIRKFIHRILNRDTRLRSVLLEFVAAAELCASCFELAIVADNYGILAYAVYLFSLTIWWGYSWGSATACPYTHLEDVIEGRTDLRVALLICWAEIGGGLAIFRYINYLWSLEIASVHKGRANAACTADLQVHMILGALVEAGATCLCRLFSRILGDLEPKFSNYIDAFFGTSLVVAAFNYSGGYFNPVLATALKYGCEGNTTIEHFVVYWIGACLGSVAALTFYNRYVRPFTQKSKLH